MFGPGIVLLVRSRSRPAMRAEGLCYAPTHDHFVPRLALDVLPSNIAAE